MRMCRVYILRNLISHVYLSLYTRHGKTRECKCDTSVKNFLLPLTMSKECVEFVRFRKREDLLSFTYTKNLALLREGLKRWIFLSFFLKQNFLSGFVSNILLMPKCMEDLSHGICKRWSECVWNFFNKIFW